MQRPRKYVWLQTSHRPSLTTSEDAVSLNVPCLETVSMRSLATKEGPLKSGRSYSVICPPHALVTARGQGALITSVIREGRDVARYDRSRKRLGAAVDTDLISCGRQENSRRTSCDRRGHLKKWRRKRSCRGLTCQVIHG